MDARFRDRPIDIEDLTDAEEFLKNFVGADKWESIHKQWLDFRVKNAPFNHPRFTIDREDNPLLPWKFMLCVPEYKELAQLAISVLSIPTGLTFFVFLFLFFCAKLRILVFYFFFVFTKKKRNCRH